MTQLFDQMTVPDPVPTPPVPTPPAPVRPARPIRQPVVDLELDRIFNTPASNELDLSRFSSSRAARRRATKQRPPRGRWLRQRAPGVVLVVAGGMLGAAIARL